MKPFKETLLKLFKSVAKGKKIKVKFLSNSLKSSKTKKNIPTPKANKRPIYCLTPQWPLKAHSSNNHRIMPIEECQRVNVGFVQSIWNSIRINQDRILP